MIFNYSRTPFLRTARDRRTYVKVGIRKIEFGQICNDLWPTCVMIYERCLFTFLNERRCYVALIKCTKTMFLSLIIVPIYLELSIKKNIVGLPSFCMSKNKETQHNVDLNVKGDFIYH